MTPEQQSAASPYGISSSIFEQLVLYFKYASSAYTPLCLRPNGNHLVSHFVNSVSEVQGFVARDSDRKEIVVAIRGSASLVDILMDSQVVLVPFVSPGVSPPHGTRIHSGFLIAWDSIAIQVISLIAAQLNLHQGFSVVTTGHSLGGSLAILAAISLKQNFPYAEIRSYSYGAPRTGNKIFAKFVNDQLGSRVFRVVHTSDGVPTIIPTSLGYHHHGIEYWQKDDPPTEENILKCSADGEDPRCSASIPSQGINSAHLTYFGITATTPFCF